MSSKEVPLERGYTAEFDTINEQEWYKIIDRFDDANIYQTWAYDAVRQGEAKLSHFILKSPEGIVSAAQARVFHPPIIGFGAAYVRWGPLWRTCNQKNDSTVFRMAIRAIRNEYVLRRGLFLRIYPVVYDDDNSGYKDILQEENYITALGERPQRTLILDLDQPLEEIRKNFDQKWRNCLNKAERNELELVQGTEDKLFGEFITIYRSLLDRKKFKEPNDINEFRTIQQKLLDKYKMRVFLTGKDGVPTCGAICTAIGNTGVYIFGACNDSGMKTNGSYIIQWNIIQWMKKNGCRYYNFNGINPKTNPGTYHFKAGAAGKRGRDVHYLGRFDSYTGSLNATIIYMANKVSKSFKRVLSWL